MKQVFLLFMLIKKNKKKLSYFIQENKKKPTQTNQYIILPLYNI